MCNVNSARQAEVLTAEVEKTFDKAEVNKRRKAAKLAAVVAAVEDRNPE